MIFASKSPDVTNGTNVTNVADVAVVVVVADAEVVAVVVDVADVTEKKCGSEANPSCCLEWQTYEANCLELAVSFKISFDITLKKTLFLLIY